MNVIFMGTPDFAVPSLGALLQAGHRVIAVYSQPDKPKGRGYQLAAPPVKEFALAHGIPVFQPAALRTPEVQAQLRAFAPDAILVAAYGKILPREVLELPKFGCINVHASLLPKYRGAAPIQWAVLNGEQETGVTIMQMAQGLDTGDILYAEKTAIGENETAGQLFDRLAELGAGALITCLSRLEAGEIQPVAQDETKATHTQKIDKSLCPIDWGRSAAEIHNQIRGLAPWPVATTTWNGKILKVHASVLSDRTGNHSGEAVVSGERLHVVCGDGNAIELTEVQLEGKRRMEIGAFLRGNPIKPGTLLGG